MALDEVSKKVGPTRTDNPAVAKLSCYKCRHYSKLMLRSGRDPIYEHTCSHPGLMDLMRVEGNLLHEDETPSWCPVTKGW